jgi:hypothetical protein
MNNSISIDSVIDAINNTPYGVHRTGGLEIQIINETILEALRFQKAALGELEHETWENLPRAIMMGRDMRCLTTAEMRQHLQNGGNEIPAWLDKELEGYRHMAKGDVVVCIFKAMIAELSKQVKGNKE